MMPLYAGTRYSLLAGGGAAAAAAGASGALDGLSDITGAWSFSRDLLSAFAGGSRYTDSAGAIITLEDQSGNNRDFTDGATSTRRPALVTTGPNNRAAAQFDGGTDFLTSAAISNFITNTTAYVILSGRADAIATSDATVQNNDAIILDSNACMGAHLHSTTPSLKGMHHDGGGTRDQTDHAITVGTVFVIELRHEGGNFSTRLNGGSWSTVASGNTLAVNGTWWLGRGVAVFSEVTVFEAAMFNVVPDDTAKDALAANFMAWIGAV